jgi:hypothetical protein
MVERGKRGEEGNGKKRGKGRRGEGGVRGKWENEGKGRKRVIGNRGEGKGE